MHPRIGLERSASDVRKTRLLEKKLRGRGYPNGDLVGLQEQKIGIQVSPNELRGCKVGRTR